MRKLSIACGLLIASGSLFAQQYTIQTIAGTGTAGWSGDLGPALLAQMNDPARVALYGGNIYVTDYGNASIRVIYPATGIMNSITGNGTQGYNPSNDGGTAVGAQLSSPHDIAFDAKGNLYIADTGNSRIRMVSNGIITTFAGSTRGLGNTAGASLGDGGQATSAQLIFPTGVAVDPSGNVYIADTGNATVRKVSPTGIITTFAGTGFLSFGAFTGEGGPATQALLGMPYSLTTDSTGNVYIVDIGLGRLFRIGSDGLIHTVQINFTAQNCALDAAGNIYAANFPNNTVQKILPNGSTLWIGGDGVAGYSGDGGPGTIAQMGQPYGLAVDKNGNVYVAEAQNAIIRELSPVPFSIGAISNAATNQPFAAPPTGVGDATIPIAPGEIVTLFGTGIGPANLVVNTPVNGVYGTQLAGTTVMIGGTAAPIIYTSATLVSAIVPYEINGLTSTTVYVTYQGQNSLTNTVQVYPTAPGIFTADASGSGQVLAANDSSGTLNNTANPASVGEYVTFYATGAGQLSPGGVDGQVTPLSQPYPLPVKSVTATVGGVEAVVGYAGAAPGLVSGVMQVNLQIPAGVLAGPAIVQLTVDTISSPNVVTVVVN